MDFVDAMQAYFAGEKLTGITMAGYGALLLVLAIALQRGSQDAFTWGFVVPLGVLGLGALVGGAVLAWKTGPQIDALVQLYRDDVATFVAQEVPRMRKVNANWVRLKIAWTVIATIAFVLVWGGFREWLTGTALALLVMSTTAMLVDVFAERRALVYSERLEAVARRG